MRKYSHFSMYICKVGAYIYIKGCVWVEATSWVKSITVNAAMGNPCLKHLQIAFYNF